MLKIVLFLFVGVTCSAGGTVTYPDVGSFSQSWPYETWPLPKSPSALSVEMLLYTRSNVGSGQIISSTSIPSVFRSGKRTIFLAHGWLKGNDWVVPYKDALLTKGDFNVITVDWDSMDFDYRQSASDTRSVGAAVAVVARHLVTRSHITRRNLWCIGHSLGGHLCGLAGKKYRFDRISGLDPAGPLFKNNVDAGLTTGSGRFVDVIHTDGLVFGLMNQLGHVDFYVNGGAYQPGCYSLMCNHNRVLQLFGDSIIGTSRCITTMKCRYYILFPLFCKTSEKQELGYNAMSYSGRGIYYVSTSATSPYCSRGVA